jgi:hypothetical protein
MRRRDDLVAWPDAASQNREVQSRCARRDAGRTPGSDKACEGRFKGRDLFAHDETGIVEDPLNSGIYFGFYGRVLRP